MRSLYFYGCLLVGLMGCATSRIPSNVRRQAESAPPFKEVFKSPQAHQGKMVLWGGRILNLVNAKEQTTLYILESPLNAYGEPRLTDESQGRFLMLAPEFLDPAIYRPDRRLSVFGRVQGGREEPIAPGQATYRYPVLEARDIYLWPEPETKPAGSSVGVSGGVGSFGRSHIGVGYGISIP